MMTTISEQLVRAIDVGLTLLTHRVLTILALLMAFGLFCSAMALGGWLHLAIAGAFGVIIFLPVLWRDQRPEPSYGKRDDQE